MEVKVLQGMHFSPLTESEKMSTKPVGSVQFSPRLRQQQRFRVVVTAHLRPARTARRDRLGALEVSCSSKDYPVSLWESGGFQSPYDEALRNKAQEIKPCLNGRCVYLVGMMGSGKSTVGKILADALGYSFSDSDTLVEQDVNRTSVADIFKLYGEAFFRDKETETLRQLSLMHWLVVSTGGGVVTRPVNWKYMRKGISVWLDVPVEALAQRIVDVGTQSRPLLHHDSGDTYQETLARLSSLLEERIEAYKCANAKVSLESIAKFGTKDVLGLEPSAIALEALKQIQHVLEEEGAFLRKS